MLYVSASVCPARTSSVLRLSPVLRLHGVGKITGLPASQALFGGRILSDWAIVVTVKPRVAPPILTGVSKLPSLLVSRMACPFLLCQKPCVLPRTTAGGGV